MARYSAEEYDNDICPRCQTKLVTQDDRCTSCGYNLISERFYSPNSFIWLSLFLSAMVPIYLSASNWGKIGKTRTKWLWLGMGLVFFAFLFTAFSALLESGHTGTKVIIYALNISFALYLREKQKSVYETAIQLGAEKGSLFIGLLVSILYTIFGVIIAIVFAYTTFTIKYYHDFSHCKDLFERKQYEKAAASFNEILRYDPKDKDVLIYLALCNYNMERLDKTAQTIASYLKHDTKNPVAYALLSRVRAKQGRQQQAKALAEKARVLDPQIFIKLFNDGDSSSDSTRTVP